MTADALRVLVIEDNPDHAQLIVHIAALADRPIDVHCADSLAGARDRLADTSVDVILLDLQLPDSAEPLGTISNMIEVAGDLPIIVLTSVNDVRLARDAVQLGAQDYLVKSDLRPDLLMRTIDYALLRHRRAVELERSNGELQNFAFVLAHELRAPLTHISLSAQSIERRYAAELPDDVHAWVSKAVRAADELSGLVNELLSFARVEAEADLEPVDSAAVVNEVLAELRPEVLEYRAEVHCGALPLVDANRLLLKHVFRNLIVNALKYRHEERAPSIDIEGRRADDGWVFSVRDNGQGIDADELDRVFGLFTRSSRVAGRPGVGIGLAFCRQAVTRLGGDMWVESRAGTGTTMSFSIPRFDVDAD